MNQTNLTSHNVSIIGDIESCFPQKFGIPRQPSLASAAKAKIRFRSGFNDPQALEGLEGFSHIWVLFIFHSCLGQSWRAQVRPPRLGGNRKKGVFATRSPFRPNYIGLSVVRLEAISKDKNGTFLKISGHDFLNATPVVDVKPYLPYVDNVPAAVGGFAHAPAGELLAVRFSELAEGKISDLASHYSELRLLIEQVIGQDPRPAYKDDYDKQYGLSLFELNIKWTVKDSVATVVDVLKSDEGSR